MAGFLLTPAAQADLDSIWDYTVDHWGVAQAERYIRDIQAACEALVDGTAVSRSAEEVRRGYRKCLVGSHVVFFMQNERMIEVVRILHQRMDFDSQM